MLVELGHVDREDVEDVDFHGEAVIVCVVHLFGAQDGTEEGEGLRGYRKGKEGGRCPGFGLDFIHGYWRTVFVDSKLDFACGWSWQCAVLIRERALNDRGQLT